LFKIRKARQEFSAPPAFIPFFWGFVPLREAVSAAQKTANPHRIAGLQRI
jgi:hypothetical protein